MRRVVVDGLTRTAYVEPGCTWLDVDGACQAHGLATTGGVASHTGVAPLDGSEWERTVERSWAPTRRGPTEVAVIGRREHGSVRGFVCSIGVTDEVWNRLDDLLLTTG